MVSPSSNGALALYTADAPRCIHHKVAAGKSVVQITRAFRAVTLIGVVTLVRTQRIAPTSLGRSARLAPSSQIGSKLQIVAGVTGSCKMHTNP
jgi:hypothetical protein